MAGLVGGYAVLKYNVKGIPVQLLWIYKNGSALLLRASEELGGIFLTVKSMSGKSLETIKKTAVPLEVSVLPNNFRAYVQVPKPTTIEQDAAITEMKSLGFKFTAAKVDRKGYVKAYLVEKEAQLTKTLAYLDVALGGMKKMRLYATVEGAGKTMDWESKVDKAGDEEDNSSEVDTSALIHEILSAAKAMVKIVSTAFTSAGQWIMPMGMGVGIGAMVVLVVMIATGHLR